MIDCTCYRPFYRDELTRQSLNVITPPIAEPISMEIARQHLRLDTSGASPESHFDDELIEQIYLPAAREYCEVISGRALARQTLEFTMQTFPRVNVAYSRPGIKIPLGPALSLLLFSYLDSDGLETFFSEVDYQLDLYSDSGYIYPAAGTVWPTLTTGVIHSVRVQYIAGYNDDADSPQNRRMPVRYKQAILLMLGHFYENRAQFEILPQVPRELELGVRALLKPDALINGFA